MKPNEYITSDTHFGHTNVIKYSNRPFADAREMDEALIERWNAKVPRGATVYHVGDFAFVPRTKMPYYLDRLHGQICLIRGNHDRIIKGALAKRVAWVKDYYESRTPDGTMVVMCHYAMEVWNRSHYGSWMLHGHSHGNLPDRGNRRLDIGVDTSAANYAPYSYEEIAHLMAPRQTRPVDHHTSQTPSL